MFHIRSGLAAVACALSLAGVSHGEEPRDVTIHVDGERFKDKTKPPEVVFNGKSVGQGTTGLAGVLKELESLPPGSSVVWGPDYNRCGSCSGDEKSLPKLFPEEWRQLNALIARRKLHLSADFPGPYPERVPGAGENKAPTPGGGQRLVLTWDNYRGPGTPADEVLYSLNSRYLGRGEEALRKVAAAIKAARPGDTFDYPRYEYGGRWAMETFSDEELAKHNQRLHQIHPLGRWHDEFQALAAAHKLSIEAQKLSITSERPGVDGNNVADWEVSPRAPDIFVALGRIVTHDQQPSPPAVRLGWSGYEAAQRWPWKQPRQPESTATYTLDDVSQGQGVAGFAKAMEKLAALPLGSVVHVRASIRTQAPFTCPLIYAGRRHFERTGVEPWIGMFVWLEAIASERILKIEWIPDEAQSIRDCELNK